MSAGLIFERQPKLKAESLPQLATVSQYFLPVSRVLRHELLRCFCAVSQGHPMTEVTCDYGRVRTKQSYQSRARCNMSCCVTLALFLKVIRRLQFEFEK